MASSIISNQETRLIEEESKKKKRKKNPNSIQNKKQPTRWRTQDEHQNYSSKLIEALRQVRRTDSENESESSPPRTTGRVVREAADRALAVAAKGRTRWSRAILTNRLKLKFKKKKPRVMTGGIRSNKKHQQELSILNKNNNNKHQHQHQQPALQRKVKVLGRLVPGCQKLSFPVILEEATDYIAALEMQVRTMTALTQLLSVASSTVPPPTGDINQIGSTRSPNRPSSLSSP